MRKLNIKLISVALIMIMCFAFSGCNLLSMYLDSSQATGSDIDNTEDKGKLIVSSAINENGELVITYNDGSYDNLGPLATQDKNVNVNIEGTSVNASYATSLGLRSAVSVHCNFSVYNRYGMLSTASSAGSGIIYKLDKDTGSAFIVTNYHVVFDESSIRDNGIADEIFIRLYGSEYTTFQIKAEFVGGSNNYDIAVLRVEGSDLLKSNVFLEATFADSDETYVGQSAIAIGNPDAGGISASYGIISVYSEHITLDIGGAVSLRVMRIDTPVNSGNSGGGLFNEKGELIGIVNAKSNDTTLENIGYAIPSNIVKAVANNIIDYCYETELEKVQRALLGVTLGISDSYAYLTEDGHVKIKEEVFVSEVSKTGIAYGKLEKNDILISARIGDNTIEITKQHQIIDYLLNARIGDTVYIDVKREASDGAEQITLEFEITEECINEY